MEEGVLFVLVKMLMMKNKQRRIELKEYRLRRSRKHRLLMKLLSLIEPSCLKPHLDKSLRFLDETLVGKNNNPKTILIPPAFSFKSNFDDSVDVFVSLIHSLMCKHGHVIIDFSNCQYVSFSALFFLKQILKQYVEDQNRFIKTISIGKQRKIKIKISQPKNENELKVLKYLHALDLYHYDEFKDSDGEYLVLPTIEGRFKGYHNNRKGIASKNIVNYINASYSPLKKQLTVCAKNLIESLVSEILNNAEDHCLFKHDWYVSGVTLHDIIKNQDILELNLVIYNYGDSMYDGFEKTKSRNLANYTKLDNLYQYHKKQFSSDKYFEKESLFTLYMLGEGISRLKYEDTSRGNGTMQFLNAFADLGSIGLIDEKYKSCLSIISGHTVLTCDNDVAPYREGSHLKISLNKEKDFKKLPEPQYLHYYNRYIPGTFIDCKIYLTDKFIERT